MEGRKIKVGITHGDINGVGYEVILKTFSNPAMLDLCTPVVYGSPKVAAYHRKAMDLPANFSIISSASEAQDGRLNIVSCTDEELKVELSKPTPDGSRAALDALERASAEYSEGLFDVLVTAPANQNAVQTEEYPFSGHTAYLEERFGKGRKALKILLKDDFRMALVTGRIPLKEVSPKLTKEEVMEKIEVFHRSLKQDFGIDNPRIAVFALNPQAQSNVLVGLEEEQAIVPAVEAMTKRGILCYGPYAADTFMGLGYYRHFDGVLAMYYDQGVLPFMTLAMNEGICYTAGLSIVRTAPVHDAAYDLAGKGVASEDSFRQAIYVALDVFRRRQIEEEINARPLRKQYYEKRDDSDKLKLDTVEDE